MPYDIPILTDEQKASISELFNQNPKIDLKNLTRLVFKDDSLDGRSNQAKAIRAFLAELNIGITTTESPSEVYELTEEHKEFIRNNYQKADGKGMNIPEMIRVLFPAIKSGSNLSKEGRAVMEYMKEIDPDVYFKEDEPVDDWEYTPPKNLSTLVGKVNAYLTESKGYKWDNGIKRPQDEKRLNILWGYMKTHYFIAKASMYKKKLDRTLFEANFIRYTHNKPDLEEEEVNQFIDLASEIVTTLQAERLINQIKDLIQDHLGDPNNHNRAPQSLIEFLNSATEKWDKSKERQKKLLEKLTTDRSKRLKDREDRHDSVLRLFEAWKDEEKRIKLITLAEREKDEDAQEYDRLQSLDDVRVLIAGMTEEEARR